MGRGGFNPNQMLKQIQKMQQQMQETQDQLAEEVVEGTAGGGVVTARVKGDGMVDSISIDPDAIDPEDAEMLGRQRGPAQGQGPGGGAAQQRHPGASTAPWTRPLDRREGPLPCTKDPFRT
jgi:DNA-binding YbaB/EbfC family protein